MKSAAPLSQDFPASTLDVWREAAKKSLKGLEAATLDKKTEDGLPIHALYIPDDAVYPALAPANRDFMLRPRIDIPDIESARLQAKEEIDNGCTGLVVTTAGANAQPFGIVLKTAKDVERFCTSLPIEKISLRLDTGNDIEVAHAFLQAGFTHLHPGFDYIGAAACGGEFADLKKSFAATLEFLEEHKPAGAFVADAKLYHNAGASDTQELAFMLATAAENLRFMHQAGVPPEAALRRISLLLTADARQFASISKLRAARLLWARFSELAAGHVQSVHISAETSFRMLSAKDPYTNLIRNTLAAFSAIIGGAEKVTVLPFTSALGLGDSFARRLSRNTLHLLRDEAHVSAVQDAARGSAYVEALTLQLAESAWKIFQDIEKQGGMLKALASGAIQSAIRDKREARLQVYRNEEKKMVGITAFPDPSPRDVAVLQKYPAQKTSSPLALIPCRDAQSFEKAAKKKEAAA